MKYNNEVKKIKNLVSDDTWEMLQRHRTFIAGGAITSAFTSREVNDIDVYFRSADDFVDFVFDVYNGDFVLVATNMTSKSVLFIDKYTQAKVQCIIYRFFDSIESIFKDFDFTCCMGALDVEKEEIHLHDDFLKHNAQRYISFNQGTAYPIVSLLRVQKYIEKGYTISRPQMLRIVMRCMELDITSWEELEDHLGGMYGLQFSEVFDKSQTFDLSTAIEKLGCVETCHKKALAKNMSRNELLAKFAVQGEDAAEGRYFKWVCDAGDSLESIHRPAYKYVLGETRTEFPSGHKGVWVLGADEVLDHHNINTGGSVIIEIIPESEITGWLEYTVSGAYRVGEKKWKAAEFIREFACLQQ